MLQIVKLSSGKYAIFNTWEGYFYFDSWNGRALTYKNYKSALRQANKIVAKFEKNVLPYERKYHG